MEFSITRARPTMVERLVHDGATGARALQHGVRNIDNYLSACQLGITVCSVGLGIVAEPLLRQVLEDLIAGEVAGVTSATITFALAYGIVSMFHVVLGELAPKSLAIARTRQTGLVLMPPMRIFYMATKPVVDLFNWMGNAVLKPFGIPPASEAEEEPHTERELERLIAEAQEEGLLDLEELEFARGAFRFGDRRAREVMVARREVATLEAGLSLPEALHSAGEAGHRRLPLCEEGVGLDRPLGVINLTDLARTSGDADAELRDLVRPLAETSEATLLDDLLERMRERREHIALVRDEHGTAVGIVTLEDILEEIVGEIRDEFEPDHEPLSDGGGAILRLGGDRPLRMALRELGVDPGEHRESTLGGYLVERLGHVPEVGEAVDLDGILLRALAVDGALVTEVGVERVEREDVSPP